MHARLNTMLREILSQRIAPRRTHYIKMAHRSGPPHKRAHSRAPGEGFIVETRQAYAVGIPIGQSGEKRAQVAGLHFIEARIEGANPAHLAVVPAAVAQVTQSFRQWSANR